LRVSSSDVVARQLAKLRELIAQISPANRFYTQRLADAGVTAEVANLEEFTQRMPFTTKAELVADHTAYPPYGSNLTFPLEHYTRFCQTSGTTGRSLAILDTPESWDWMLGNWREIYRAAGVKPGDCVYFAFSFGPFLGFWTAFEAATQYGCRCLPGGGQSSAARLHGILNHRADVICCTPTYAMHLVEVAAAEGLDLSASAVRTIIVAGEPGGSVPGVRERISSAWGGAEVLDHYGMTEIGPSAYQQSGEPDVLRILEDSYFAEIIDPGTGAHIPAGDVGELVLTTLGRAACPLLRYRTGDLVRRDPDREGFALAGGIIGRADDMLVVRGVNIYPSAIDALVRSVPDITEYRVEVSRRGVLSELALQVEAQGDASVRDLERALTGAFALRIPVTRVECGTLPRFELKARRWVQREN
jgi:phenylacetate-CoA ligase